MMRKNEKDYGERYYGFKRNNECVNNQELVKQSSSLKTRIRCSKFQQLNIIASILEMKHAIAL